MSTPTYRQILFFFFAMFFPFAAALLHHKVFFVSTEFLFGTNQTPFRLFVSPHDHRTSIDPLHRLDPALQQPPSPTPPKHLDASVTLPQTLGPPRTVTCSPGRRSLSLGPPLSKPAANGPPIPLPFRFSLHSLRDSDRIPSLSASPRRFGVRSLPPITLGRKPGSLSGLFGFRFVAWFFFEHEIARPPSGFHICRYSVTVPYVGVPGPLARQRNSFGFSF